MNKYALMEALVEGWLGVPVHSITPVSMSGFDVVEALWPWNDRFKAHFREGDLRACGKASGTQLGCDLCAHRQDSA